MNIPQLRAFVAVVDHGSFSAAARFMGVSQPAVTMQIQTLEQSVGATLLERRYRKIDLTEAGRVLLPHARRVLDDLDLAQDELSNLSDVVGGHLVLAASTTPGQYILPGLLGGFMKAYPEVGVSIEIADTAQVIEWVEAGRANLGVVGAKLRGTRVEYEQLTTDALVLICAPDEPLLTSAALVISDIVEAPFVMRESGSGTRQVAEEALRLGGIAAEDVRVVTELGSSEAIVSAVEGGLGLGIVSRFVAEKALRLGTVKELPVADFPVERPLYLVKPRAALTRAADAFNRHLLSTVAP